MRNYYLDGWEGMRLPVVPIEDERVNMFHDHGVRMSMVVGSALPYGSFKFLAVLGLLSAAKEQGVFERGDVLVEATSGRTGYALAQVARAEPFGASDIILVMKQDVPRTKEMAPIVAGARVIRPEIGLSPVATARKMGGGGWKPDGWKKKDGDNILNLDQYANPAIKTLYRDWAVPKIIEEAGEFEVLVAPIGTGGTLVGLSEGFRNRFDHPITIVGAMCADGHEIPGMRDLANMVEITQPWQAALDYRIEVERNPSFLCAPRLNWSTGVPAGPSGGATYVAGCRFIQQLIKKGELDRVRNRKTGLIRLLVVVHDDIGPYVADRFTTEYPLDDFHPTTAPLPKQLVFG